jgi:hypothetical protein
MVQTRCCAQTAKGTRCQHYACEESENGLCKTHHKKYIDDPESIVFYVSKGNTPSSSKVSSGNKIAHDDGEPEVEKVVCKPTKRGTSVRAPDDGETSWNTNDLFDMALNLEPEIEEVMQDINITNDIWSSIAVNFTSPKFSSPNKKQSVPKKRLTPKLLLNLSLWMFYRDCCKTPNINNVIRNQIIREGLVKGALLATKDKVVEENGVAKTTKVEIIPYQLVKYATDQVWQRLPEAMREKYFKAVRDDYQRRTAV